MSARHRHFTILALAFGVFIALSGCKDPNPGIVDKPPPKGGPHATGRRPPGEVNNANVR